MLIQLGVNQGLAKCHSLSRRIPGSIVMWNGSSYELVTETNKFQARLWAGIIAGGGAFYGLNSWTAWKSGGGGDGDDLAMSILCGFLAFASASIASTLLIFRGNGSDCAAFLNGLLAIENNWKRDKVFQQVIRGNALVKLLTRILIANQCLYPWIFSLVASSFPGSPLNMFSSVIGSWWNCGDGDDDAFSWRYWLLRATIGLGTAAPHLLFWKALTSQAAMDAMHMFLGCLCQQSLMTFIAQLLRSGRPFQLNLYRSCQLLNVSFSNYCSSVGFYLIGAVMVAEISCSFLVLKVFNGTSSLPLLIKIMLVALCPSSYLVHVVPVGEAAAVNTTSISVLTKVRKAEDGTMQQSNKLSRRQARSAWPLKVKFGECNFIEAATTLVMLDFILRRLVDLLIIGKRR